MKHSLESKIKKSSTRDNLQVKNQRILRLSFREIEMRLSISLNHLLKRKNVWFNSRKSKKRGTKQSKHNKQTQLLARNSNRSCCLRMMSRMSMAIIIIIITSRSKNASDLDKQAMKEPRRKSDLSHRNSMRSLPKPMNSANKINSNPSRRLSNDLSIH